MLTIRPGIRVEWEVKRHPATLGVIIKSGGKLFSFLPRYAVAGRSFIKTIDLGALVGQVADKPAVPPAEEVGCEEALALVELCGDCRVEGSLVKAGDPLEDRFDEVTKASLDESVEGKITALDGPFWLPAKDSDQIIKYNGVMEISGGGFGQQGDGGAAVLSMDGTLLGILIAKAGQKFVCVPSTALDLLKSEDSEIFV